mmetsp:Transcript_36722/g.105893  ORF Transcript_36722/g.105893 Transcript_36722/m.105893 type:complete len:227 (-) Transcript_36722:741-1421(-)
MRKSLQNKSRNCSVIAITSGSSSMPEMRRFLFHAACSSPSTAGGGACASEEPPAAPPTDCKRLFDVVCVISMLFRRGDGGADKHEVCGRRLHSTLFCCSQSALRTVWTARNLSMNASTGSTFLGQRRRMSMSITTMKSRLQTRGNTGARLSQLGSTVSASPGTTRRLLARRSNCETAQMYGMRSWSTRSTSKMNWQNVERSTPKEKGMPVAVTQSLTQRMTSITSL